MRHACKANALLGLETALGRRPGGYRLKETAGVLKVGDYASIALAIRRLHDKVRADQGLTNALTTMTGGLVEGLTQGPEGNRVAGIVA
ncbi:MAG: hypothetical protein ACE5IQ_04155 [Candidatus Methylomirabilales bacterium]